MKNKILWPSMALLSLDNYQELSKADIIILHYLLSIFRERKKSITIKHLYITPSQKAIATATGYTRETVNRSIQKLHQLGYIWKTVRRKEYGQWQTCLYKIGNKLLKKVKWIWNKIKGDIFKKPPCDVNHTHSDHYNNDFISQKPESIKNTLSSLGFT
jgi:DNA-binding MarR family transcriptional regulator